MNTVRYWLFAAFICLLAGVAGFVIGARMAIGK
jgi:hypothetical protein